MRERINKIFYGRQGMDELSKALFWAGLAFLALSILCSGILNNVLSSLFNWFGLLMVVFCFIRALSRRLQQREAENSLFLAWRAKRKRSFEAFKERRRQSRDFRFYKCPGCGRFLRVPRGKGKIHISCKCGYTLYRRT